MDAPLLTAVDVGTTKICTLVAEMTSETEFEIIGVGLEPARGMRKGVVVNVDEAGAAIRESVVKAERTSGLEIGQAMERACAAASLSCLTAGAQAGMPGRDALERHLAQA